jgi:hypothetical protein
MTSRNPYRGPLELEALGSKSSSPVIIPSGTSVTYATSEAGPYTITVAGATPFLGLVAGDFISITGAANAANNGAKEIVSVDSAGTVATVVEATAMETDSTPNSVITYL